MSSGEYTLYKHVAPNGKVYVGVTCRPVEERWGKGNGYRSNRHFWSAIRKYGWENISHEVLATNLSKADAEALERRFIADLGTYDPAKGYNSDMGGWSIGRASEETKKKISLASKRHWQDEEYRKRVSSSLKGRVFSDEHRARLKVKATGRRKTDAERAFISERVQGKNTGSSNPHARAVVNLTTGERYGSIAEAAKAIGAHYSAISAVCSGKHKTAGGYVWGYADE